MGAPFGTEGMQIVENRFGETVPYQAYPDNVKDFFQTAYLFTNNVGLRGGNPGCELRFQRGAYQTGGHNP